MTIKKLLIGIAGLMTALLVTSTGTANAQYRSWNWGEPYDQRYDRSDWFFDQYHEDNIAPGQFREIYGRVLAVKTAYVGNHREPHLLALITTYSKQKLVVDLGSAWKARRLALRPYGDRLWVTGELVNIRGRWVVLARTARTEFRRIVANRHERFYRGQRVIIRDNRARSDRRYDDRYQNY